MSCPAIASPSMPDLGGDGAGGVEVVAGDHLHVDAGAGGGGDRGGYFGAGRVEQADQSVQHEAVGELDEVIDIVAGGRVLGRA